MMETVICSGFGGQGALSLGNILAITLMNKGKNVTWFPAYGAEMRGGTANCTVIYSDELIGSPFVTNVTMLIAMNQPSVDKFINSVVPGGKVIINSSVVKKKIERDDVDVYYVDATDIATEMGLVKAQNMVMLGTVMKATNHFDLNDVEVAFKEKFTGKKAQFIPKNMEAVQKGMEVEKA